MKKILTVIVPAYNMERYLTRCLGSLLLDENRIKSLEVLVVNDGSKDKTGSIAQVYSERLPDVFRVVNKPNGHYGSCINAAMKIASGIYVKVLDADDYFATDEFNRLLENLENDDCVYDVVLTDFDTVDEYGNVTTHFSSEKLVEKGASIPMHALTYRLGLLKKIDYRQTEGVAYTDSEWAFLPVAMASSVKYVPLTVYKYLVGRSGQSVERSVTARNLGEMVTVFKSMGRQYKKYAKAMDAKGLRYLENCLIRVSNLVYMNYMFYVPCLIACKELPIFDAAVGKELPFCIHAADELSISRVLKIRYVRIWRRYPFSSGMIMCMLRAYMGLVGIVQKFRGV